MTNTGRKQILEILRKRFAGKAVDELRREVYQGVTLTGVGRWWWWELRSNNKANGYL